VRLTDEDRETIRKLRGRIASLEGQVAEHKATLRDRFALAALTGLIARIATGGSDVLAMAAYDAADAMLAARESKGGREP
jgi:hypothetical protein